MDITLLLRMAVVGIVTSLLSALLKQQGRDDIAMMTTVVGLIVVLLMTIGMITKLFSTITTMFTF